MDSLSTLDWVALAVLGLAVLRGLWTGLIREAFSLAAIALACVAVRFGTVPAGDWIVDEAPFVVSPLGARIAAGSLLAAGAIGVVGIVERVARRGARAVGLGLADRIGGGVLGAAEGGLILAILLLLAVAVVGREHPSLAESRTFQAFESVEQLARGSAPATPDVATPPPEPDG